MEEVVTLLEAYEDSRFYKRTLRSFIAEREREVNSIRILMSLYPCPLTSKVSAILRGAKAPDWRVLMLIHRCSYINLLENQSRRQKKLHSLKIIFKHLIRKEN